MADSYRAIPELRRVIIEVVDDEKFDPDNATFDENGTMIVPTIRKAYIGYVKGPGTPVPVAIECDRIDAEYEENYPSDSDRETLKFNEYYARFMRANYLLYRDTLMTVVRGLDAEQANLLASNPQGREILIALKWISVNAPSETAPNEATDDMGEAVSAESGAST